MNKQKKNVLQNLIEHLTKPNKNAILNILKSRSMESGCAYNTMASNNATKFCHKIKTNAMGESTNAH